MKTKAMSYNTIATISASGDTGFIPVGTPYCQKNSVVLFGYDDVDGTEYKYDGFVIFKNINIQNDAIIESAYVKLTSLGDNRNNYANIKISFCKKRCCVWM